VALLGGAAGIGAVRSVARLERRFTQLGIQADVSDEKIGKLKDRIFEVANAPDIRLDPSQITAAIEQIVEKTGDLKFAEDNLRNIGLAIQAASAQGGQIGGVTAEFRKFGLVSKEEVSKALDTLVRQGKVGAFTLANLAAQGERLAAAYAVTGRRGQGAVREMGAVIQIIRQGTGNAEQAATAFEALLRTLQNADKIKALQQRGITIFEPGQPGVMRSVAAIMTDIIKGSKGSAVALSQVFDAEAMRAFNAGASEFKDTGALPTLEKFLKIQGDGRAIVADSARKAKDAVGAWQGVSTAAQKFADAALAGPIRDIADAVNAIDDKKLQSIMKSLAVGGTALAGLWAASKGVRAVHSLAGALGASVAGGAGAAMKFGPRVGRLPTAAAAIVGGVKAYDALTDKSLGPAQKGAATGGAAGGVAGAFLGAKAGGALGLLGGPAAPVTVPLGMMIGGTVGYFLGEGAGARLGADIARAMAETPGVGEARAPTEIDIKMKIEGAPPGTRTEIETNKPGAKIRIDQGPAMLPFGS